MNFKKCRARSAKSLFVNNVPGNGNQFPKLTIILDDYLERKCKKEIENILYDDLDCYEIDMGKEISPKLYNILKNLIPQKLDFNYFWIEFVQLNMVFLCQLKKLFLYYMLII